MYNATPDDLARIANDLDQLARRYQQGSQELEQHITNLDNTASHLLYGASRPWTGCPLGTDSGRSPSTTKNSHTSRNQRGEQLTAAIHFWTIRKRKRIL
jgi:hypothetical protein